ncbi:hypothetical protein [Spiroplasma poulsonii]|uniref:Uncharacterized protein n=1 Tax=Spiroplasma poulsonii TaxID=2138 RepID=A0A2P6FFH3_9MOLU|nr:hypothetical protein [Spiroplasma poulsonii]KAF0850016.1 Ribonuclease Y [Spiroplasma poulsonii]PQM32193.1 hypothetical protein SMSRO_SF020950 [Spiroplasma poulsonii]PWF94839.1 hypothetical protein SMSE_02630 [Spiroplasma poulsonii]PWF97638.1 hypothetical protein SMH99_01870 [Spiroplasma poulsonii]
MEISIWVITIIAVAIGFYFLGFLCEKYLRFKLIKKTKLKIKQAEEKAKKLLMLQKLMENLKQHKFDKKWIMN